MLYPVLYMSLTIYEQIKQLIDDKKHILVTFKTDGRGDAIGSAAALLVFLHAMGKRADAVVEGFTLPREYAFVAGSREIREQAPHLQKFIITVDIKNTGLDELSYDVNDGQLRIFVTPRSGSLSREAVRTAQSDFTYDLVITVDTQDLNSLGELYQSNTDLFYKTPVINIDHDPANEQYGAVNLVDVTSTSTAEVVYELMKKIGEEHITADIATALLTGMIAKTRSFRGDNVKPHTLAVAGKLVAAGANRDYIVQNLFRTRTIATLKLWGQALARLESDKTLGLVWTSITREDFVRSGATEHDLHDIIDELIRNSPEAKTIILFHEHATADKPHAIHCLIAADATKNAVELLAPFQGHGNKQQASAIIEGKTLKEAEEAVLNHLKTVLK